MSSQIGKKGLMQSLGRVLGIIDPRVAPNRLKTDELVPVISIDPGMAGGGHVQLVGQVSLAGLTGWTWQIIGSPDIGSTPGLPPQAFLPANGDLEAVILGIRAEVRFTGVVPPAVGERGRMLRIGEFRQAAGNLVSAVRASVFNSAHTIDNTQWQYIWSYPMWQAQQYAGNDPPGPYPWGQMAASPIYVPAGSKYGLECQYWLSDLSNLAAFPAGTLLTVEAFISTAPKGMRPPGI